MTACIVGLAHTPFGKQDAESVESLIVRVARDALADAGIAASDVDEIAFAGLTALPSVKVGAPRIAEAPCAMECVVEQTIDYDARCIVLGRVVHMHARAECLDADGHYIVPEKYLPIARLHADNYIVADRQFELKKPADLLHYEAASGYAAPAPVKATV